MNAPSDVFGGLRESSGPTAKVEYDDEKHEYKLNGKVVPSVTQIIKRLGFISDRYTADGATRGTYIAQATELDDSGELDYEALDERLRPYVDAWRKFKAESRFVVAGSEKIVYRDTVPLAYAGRIDRLGKMPPTKASPIEDWVIDIKTGDPACWHPLQITGYAVCLPTAHRRGVVYLRDNGNYTLSEVVSPMTYGIWLACCQVYAYMEANK